MRLLDGMPYTPSVATNIRETFARINKADDWRCRVEGALEVMRKYTPPAETSNVMRLPTRERR